MSIECHSDDLASSMRKGTRYEGVGLGLGLER